jgi:hypothetical protein
MKDERLKDEIPIAIGRKIERYFSAEQPGTRYQLIILMKVKRFK